MQVPRTQSAGYPGYNTYTGMATPGMSQYSQAAQLPGNTASWGVGKEQLPTANSFGVMPTYSGSTASGQMPMAQPSMLTPASSFPNQGNSFNANSFGSLTPGLFNTAPFSLDRSTSGQIGRYNFTFEANPPGGGGMPSGMSTGMAGLTPPLGLGTPSLGATSNGMPMPGGSMGSGQSAMQQPSQQLQTRPSHFYNMEASDAAVVTPAARGRAALLQKHENPTYGVSQEPIGCTVQLDDCVLRCRRDVQAIAEECRRRGQKYCDNEFPAHSSALFANGRTPSRSSTARPEVSHPCFWLPTHCPLA